MSRYRAAFLDPDGDRHGCPTWPWQCSPPHLLTRRQLTERGLRPGGQPVAGQVLWRGIGGTRVAYLYDVRLAARKRTPSPAQRAALAKALAARRRCPTCRRDLDYYIPRSLGECLDCHDDTRLRWTA